MRWDASTQRPWQHATTVQSSTAACNSIVPKQRQLHAQHGGRGGGVILACWE